MVCVRLKKSFLLVYRIQTNNSSSNILNQTLQNNNNNNSYSSSNLTNVLNNPSISQQRSSYLQQGRILNNQSIEQQNVYEQYSSQQSRIILFLI